MGPVANLQQFTKTQDMIERAIKDGAKLLTGGLGRPDNLSRGFFVKPTIFSEVDNRHMIAREEIFGPVLCITPYDNLDHAISLANDSDYGLSGYVGASDHETAISIARRLRTGSVLSTERQSTLWRHSVATKNQAMVGSGGLRDY